jgi:hypothetical protein
VGAVGTTSDGGDAWRVAAATGAVGGGGPLHAEAMTVRAIARIGPEWRRLGMGAILGWAATVAE